MWWWERHCTEWDLRVSGRGAMRDTAPDVHWRDSGCGTRGNTAAVGTGICCGCVARGDIATIGTGRVFG